MKFFFLVIALCLGEISSALTFSSGSPSQKGWAQRPLLIYVNRDNCPSALDNFINEAIFLWNNVPESSLKLEIGPDTTQSIAEVINGTATDVPMIACDSAFSTTFSVDGDTIPGVGFVNGDTFDPIISGGLVLNVEAGKADNINNLSDTIVSVVVAHEIGHMLGFGHSSDVNALMYYSASYRQQLSLSQDDRDTASFLYPRKEASFLKYVGGCGAIHSVKDSDIGNEFWNGNSLMFFTVMYLLFYILLQLWRSSKISKKVLKSFSFDYKGPF